MQLDTPDLARIARMDDGSWRAEFFRDFDHSPQVVWAYLTRSDLLAQWLAPGRIDLREDGRARLDFVDSGIVIDSPVTRVDPDHLLEYSWSGPGEPQRLLTWTITALLDGCRLTLVLRAPEDEDVARSCAGWDAHLDMLAAALEGVPIKFPFQRFKDARETYKARLPA
jgi:uncharacterized protein YndB with AHSA1/START domain